MNATLEQLQKVELIGPKKAAAIRKIIGSDYRPERNSANGGRLS